jgi:hypothetical protein
MTVIIGISPRARKEFLISHWHSKLCGNHGSRVVKNRTQARREEKLPALTAWENFYVIVGSSAGALIGLQFVVITLIADLPNIRDGEQASSAFATPTIVHFGAVLLLAAIINIPWYGITSAAISWGMLGLAGVIYEIIVARRMRTQTAYSPEFEDLLFHFLLPFAAYVILAASAFAGRSHEHGALLAVASSALLLLFIGIHNAWDAVTYHVFVSRPKHKNQKTSTNQVTERKP